MEELVLDRMKALLPTYVTAGPRYTSYPTAPVWTERFGAEDHRRALERAAKRTGEELALYVHVPFCRALCHFCACNRLVPRQAEIPERYLATLEAEIRAARDVLGSGRPAGQLHLGGGTPTYLEPGQLARMFRALYDAFRFEPDAELSLEVDPRVTTADHVRVLREFGFHRISMGVQDFDAHVQQAIHRIQPIEQVRELLDRARAEGFRSANFDLVYGLPFQTEESFGKTLDAVLALGPDRIALYSYAHVTWVAKQQRGFERKDLPGPERKIAIFLSAIRRLLDAGYVYIGMDHFARPDDELHQALLDRTLRRNFMGYTTRAGTELVGFGPSAISELEGTYAQSYRELGRWQQAVNERGLATMRGWALSADDQARRWVIMRILCLGELRADEYEALFGEPFARRYEDELARLDPMIADGLVERATDGSVRVTSSGRILVRNIAATFDAYLAEQTRSAKPLFSQTV